jgi:hypothetical protein
MTRHGTWEPKTDDLRIPSASGGEKKNVLHSFSRLLGDGIWADGRYTDEGGGKEGRREGVAEPSAPEKGTDVKGRRGGADAGLGMR